MLSPLQLVVIVKSMMPTGEGDAFATVKVGSGVLLESQRHNRCSFKGKRPFFLLSKQKCCFFEVRHPQGRIFLIA